jgi:hypothetical protein
MDSEANASDCIQAQLKQSKDLDRVAEFLGPFERVLHPIWGLAFCLALFLLGWPLLHRTWELSLCCWSLYLVFMAANLERRWLALSSLPPLFVVTVAGSLRWGLGGILILSGGKYPADSFYVAYSEHLLEAQLLWAIFSSVLLLSFVITRRWSECLSERASVRFKQGNRRLIWRVALATGVFAVAYVLIGFLAGTLDRSGEIYNYWVARFWRADSAFTIFLRLKNIFFFLAPLAIVLVSGFRRKAFLLALIVLGILFALLSGGRGIVLYPLVYMMFGLWLTPVRVKLFRGLVLAIIVICILMVPAIDIYRNMHSFQHDSRFDIGQRVQLLARAVTDFGDNSFLARIQNAGGSLYACSDPYLFVDPAKSAPRAGLVRAERLWQVWMPTMLNPNKPPLRDAHMIAAEISGATRHQAETMRYTSFMCVSFGADLYWRGGWLWVWSGSVVFAVFYRCLAQVWYRWAQPSSLIQLAIWIYPVTFLIDFPAGSLGETAWIWLWDFPKYALLVVLILAIQSGLARFSRSPA